MSDTNTTSPRQQTLLSVRLWVVGGPGKDYKEKVVGDELYGSEGGCGTRGTGRLPWLEKGVSVCGEADGEVTASDLL